MNISQTLDQAADSLERVNWKQVTKELIELWDLIWKILILSIIFTHLAGKSLGNWVHSTNDRLAANWVRLIVVPPTPAEEQAQIIVEVELNLPLALEPLAIMFTAPLILAATQAPVALLVSGQEVVQQPPPAVTNGRRKRGRSRATQKA